MVAISEESHISSLASSGYVISSNPLWRIIRIGSGDRERRRHDGAWSRHLIMVRLVGPSKAPLHVVECGHDSRRWNRHEVGRDRLYYAATRARDLHLAYTSLTSSLLTS